MDPLINTWAHRRGLPPQFIKSHIRLESGANFNRTAYRYEPLFDCRSIQSQPTVILNATPYSVYTLPPGANTELLIPADIRPRTLYTLPTTPPEYPTALALTLANLRQNWIWSEERLRQIATEANFREQVRQGRLTKRTCQGKDVTEVDVSTIPGFLAQGSTGDNFTTASSVLNFTAQTTIGSAYGLMQVQYTTAIAERWEGFQNNNNLIGKNPSYLLDTEENLQNNLGSVSLGTSLVTGEFTDRHQTNLPGNIETYNRWLADALRGYNQAVTYPLRVTDFLSGFQPVMNKNIFLEYDNNF